MFADDNVKFDDTGSKFSKRVKNAVGKKEKLLVMSNFSNSRSVFKRLPLQTCENKGLFGKGLILYFIDTHFNASATDSFGNIVGKGEIARNKQFLLFPQCFLHNQKPVSPFVNIYDIISLFAAELEKPKIDIRGERLTLYSIDTHFNASATDSF